MNIFATEIPPSEGQRKASFYSRYAMLPNDVRCQSRVIEPQENEQRAGRFPAGIISMESNAQL